MSQHRLLTKGKAKKKNTNVPEGWVQIWSEAQLYLAEMMRSRLETQGIPVLIVNKQDRNYHFGDIEIHVKNQDVIRAKHICKDQMT